VGNELTLRGINSTDFDEVKINEPFFMIHDGHKILNVDGDVAAIL